MKQKVSKAHIPPAVAIISHNTLISWIERRIGQMKGLISNMWLILVFNVDLVTLKVHTKSEDQHFISLSQVFAEKSLTEDDHMHYMYIGVRDGKKESKINISVLILFYTIYLTIHKVYTKSRDPCFNRS